MKVWQLAYPHNLQHVNAPDLKLTDDKVKVKVTKALLTESDVAVYTGATKVKAPFIPGRFAIGQVTEANDDSFIHKGERLEQCKIYSENFYSVNPIVYDKDISFSCDSESEQGTGELLIQKFKDAKLQDCVLKIEPYVGLNYSRFNFKGVKAVLHTTYHSGTACVIKTETRKSYNSASILSLLDKCKKLNVDFYYNPSKVGDDAEKYDTVPQIQNHNGGHANFFYGTTNELLYAKLLIAYSMNLSKKYPLP